MADYNKNYMAAYKQYADTMTAGGGGTNLSGAGSSTMQVWNYGNDDQPSGLGAPTTKPKEEKKSENFWDRITNLFTSNDVDVTSVYTPSVNPTSLYDSDAFKAPEVSDYVYRAEMSEQTQDMVEQAMGYEKTKLGQLQLLDTRAMSEEEKERLGPLLDLADDIGNENITTTELPPIEGEQQSSLMDALMEGQPTAGLMQRPSVFTGQETQIASTLPDWMEALPIEGFSQALIDIREGRIDRETGQPIVQEEEVDLTPPEAADQELIPTTTASPEQTGLMSRPAPEAETPAVDEETTTTPITETSEAQQRLFDLGYVEVGTADGIVGPNTSSAVTRYQEQNGLEVTGELDQATLDSLSGAEADLDTTVRRQIAHHEGQRNYPYKDSRDLWTIGIGHLIGNGSDKALADSGYSQYSEANPMPDSEVEDLFDDDLEEHKDIAEGYPFYDDMSDEGKRAILDLTFNMGDFYNKKKADDTYEWANLRTQLNNGDWDAAADNLASSAYARQVGRRATTVTNLLRQAGN